MFDTSFGHVCNQRCTHHISVNFHNWQSRSNRTRTFQGRRKSQSIGGHYIKFLERRLREVIYKIQNMVGICIPLSFQLITALHMNTLLLRNNFVLSIYVIYVSLKNGIIARIIITQPCIKSYWQLLIFQARKQHHFIWTSMTTIHKFSHIIVSFTLKEVYFSSSICVLHIL